MKDLSIYQQFETAKLKKNIMLFVVLFTLCTSSALAQDVQDGTSGVQAETREALQDQKSNSQGDTLDIGNQEIQNFTLNEFYQYTRKSSLKSPIVREDTWPYNIYNEKPFTGTIYNVYMTAF